MGTPVVTRRRLAVAAVVALSIGLHLWKLGERPLAHDEAIDAWFSWQAIHGVVVSYDPVYHGPLRFYLEGAAMRVFGTSAGDARLLAATAGVATTALIAASWRTLGRFGSVVAALIATISPTVLTVTRTGREDSLIGLISVALLLLAAAMMTRPRPWHPAALGTLLGASFAVKETTFLFGAVAAVFVVPALMVAFTRPESAPAGALSGLVALGRAAWLWMLTAFVAVFALAFTAGFRDPGGLASGVVDGVRYWWSQHDVGRGGQPWFFYLAVYATYEWVLLGGALLGAIVARSTLVGRWLIWMSVGQLIIYTWAGEKFAWLALHPLLPAVLLTGLGAEWLRRRVADLTGPGLVGVRAALVASAAAAFAATTLIAVRPAITHGADPRELLVTVQTATDVPPIAARLVGLVESGRIERIAVDDSGGGSWPWAWYLQPVHQRVEFVTIDPTSIPTNFDAIIVGGALTEPETPPGYRLERFRLRVWWVPDYGGASVGDLLRWLTTRNVWSPTASYDQFLLIRESAGG